VVADLYVFGGAAMAVAYDARRATRDVDALFMPHGIVLDEAQAVAKEFGLPGWWLNEQASAYVAPGGDPDAKLVFDHPGLRVSAASPEHLLAMKVLAARRGAATPRTSPSSSTTSACQARTRSSPCAPRSSRKSRCRTGPGSY